MRLLYASESVTSIYQLNLYLYLNILDTINYDPLTTLDKYANGKIVVIPVIQYVKDHLTSYSTASYTLFSSSGQFRKIDVTVAICQFVPRYIPL